MGPYSIEGAQMRPRLLSLFLLSATFVLPATLRAQDAASFFKQNCASCHTIGGGRLTGPDLKDVTRRRDRAWLTNWLQNPQAVAGSGDAYAQQLVADSRGVIMPSVSGMNPAVAATLLDLIDAESKLPKSRFAGTQVDNRPFTAADVALGRRLFTGAQRLRGGGPACMSCHTLRGLSALGGGRLGPDLTLVYERLQGRQGLTAWLGNPASPTMTPVFATKAMQAGEIRALTALFDDAARKGGQADSSTALDFVLLGMGGAVIGMVSLDMVWKKRFRGVRRALVLKSRGEE